MNSPRTRSPHLMKRNSERSPTMSPRRINNNSNNMQSSILSKVPPPPPSVATTVSQMADNQMKSRLLSNSMHVTPPHVNSGCLTSEDDDDEDDDSDHVNMDKLKTIRNKAAQR